MIVFQRDRLTDTTKLPPSILQSFSQRSDAAVWDVARRYGLPASFLAECCMPEVTCKLSSTLCPDPSLQTRYPELSNKAITPLYETETYLCVSTTNPFYEELGQWQCLHQKEIRPIVIADEVSHDVQLDQLIHEAVQKKASDIHFFSTETSLAIHFRILGSLTPFVQLPKQSPLIQKIKLISHMDISCHTLPQDGQFTLESLDVDIRVSSLPTLFGEDLVLRLLPRKGQFQSLNDLGFPCDVRDSLRTLLQLKSGLVLVTGPTGSGKTTTLYALLSELTQRKNLSIVTIEDPIEIHLPGIRQSQINPKIDYHFPQALKAILRQDPDVIMIGEIRDKETAKTALDAAYTGHLVFATLHTDTIEGTLHRLSSFECDPFLVSECVKGILTQKLERVQCTCETGCPTCQFSGFSKRVPKGILKHLDTQLWF